MAVLAQIVLVRASVRQNTDRIKVQVEPRAGSGDDVTC
jgi:hypothetical protein